MSCRNGATFELKLAQMDVKDIIDERGAKIKVNIHRESSVTRDDYGSIISHNTAVQTIEIFAFPILYSPTEKQRENAGIREKTEVIITTAKLDWINAGVSFDEFDSITAEFILHTDNDDMKNNRYEIKDRTQIDHMVNDFLYINFGLNRKK